MICDGWVHGCWVDGLFSGSMGGVRSLKIDINFDLIQIIQCCLEIYDLLRHSHLWVGVLIVGSMDGLMGRLCQMTSNGGNLDLIEIIQFCLQIYDLRRYLHAHTTHWSQSLVIEHHLYFNCLTF